MDVIALIKDHALRYYGVDWLVMLCGFIGIYLLDRKKKMGFVFGMGGCLFGLIFSWQMGSLANAIASTVLFFLHLYGLIRWSHKTRPPIKRKNGG